MSLHRFSVFDAGAVLPDDAQLRRQPLDLHDLQPQPRRGALQRLLPRRILLRRRRLSAQGRYSVTASDVSISHNFSNVFNDLLVKLKTVHQPAATQDVSQLNRR